MTLHLNFVSLFHEINFVQFWSMLINFDQCWSILINVVQVRSMLFKFDQCWSSLIKNYQVQSILIKFNQSRIRSVLVFPQFVFKTDGKFELCKFLKSSTRVRLIRINLGINSRQAVVMWQWQISRFCYFSKGLYLWI